MFCFGYHWTLRYLKFSEIVMLLFLMMTTLFMMPWNVWGDEIYTYRDKEGTIVITNIYPQENTNFNTWDSNLYQDSKLIDKDGNMVVTNMPPQENIDSNAGKSNTYKDLTPKGRLHWGRDNALIDVQKRRYGQRKTVKDSRGMEAGIYKIKIKKIAINLYQDIDTRSIIKTRDCVELAGGDEALLDWSGVSGKLFFKDMKNSCIVRKVYK